MMKVRSINVDELEQFVQITERAENMAGEREFIRDLWAKGLSQPEWFFLAERDREALGRVAYWRLKARPEELRLIFLTLPWQRDYLDTGQLFAILKEDTFFSPDWLQLAFDARGLLAGLVAPD